MSQQSEERLPESASADANSLPSARILHLKSRQSDLQRAIQLRAQQSVERERELDQERRRPKPLKWLIISAIACIPVLLTLTAVDGFLRALHKYMDVAITSQPQVQPAAPVEEELPQSQPGVVMLQPLNTPEASSQPATPPSAPSQEPGATAEKTAPADQRP
jgi:hypothetical protein